MTEADADRLRNAGWSDRTLLDIVLITTYVNFVNRTATDPGVEITPKDVGGYEY